MILRKAALVAAVGAASAVVPASTAGALHTHAGPGGCADHTLTCWPGCGWEWAGVQEVEAKPCEMPVSAWVAGADGGSVAAHLTTTVTVAGVVTADQAAGDSYAVHRSDESSTALAADVFVTNDGFDGTTVRVILALAGLSMAFTVGGVLFRRTWR